MPLGLVLPVLLLISTVVRTKWLLSLKCALNRNNKNNSKTVSYASEISLVIVALSTARRLELPLG